MLTKRLNPDVLCFGKHSGRSNAELFEEWMRIENTAAANWPTLTLAAAYYVK